MELKHWLSFGALIVWGLYIPLNYRQSKYYFKTKWDEKVPLVRWTVWIYSLFIPYVFLTPVLLWNSGVIVERLLGAIFLSGLVANIFWWFVPNGVKRPKLGSVKSISEKLLNWLYKNDGDTNGLPSGHVFYTLITSYYLTSYYSEWFWPVWIISAGIMASALTTKQHYIWDVVVGVIFGVLAIGVVGLV